MLHGLAEFIGGDESGFDFLDLLKHGVAGGGELIRIHDGADAEQSRIAGAVGPGVDVMGDAFLFANFLIQARAAAVAEQNREDIQRGDIGMAQLGDVPGKMHVAHFDGRFLDDFARGGLDRFLGQNHRRHRFGLGVFVGRADLGDDVVGFHIAGDDEEHVVGRIFLAIITVDVVGLDFVENVRVADNGEAIRTAGVGGHEQAAAGAAIGIVDVHVHFAADDVHFLGQFIRRQRGVLHDVAQNIDGRARAGVGHINMIDRAIEAGVGVHVTADFLHFLIDAAAGAGGGAFEEHVFEHVREAGAEPFAFMNASGHGPGLGRDDGRAVVFAHDDGEAVVERGGGHALRLGGEIAVGIWFAHLVKIERSRYSELGGGQIEFGVRGAGISPGE